LSHVIKAAVLQGEGCRDTGRGASSWSTLVRGAINRLRASAPPDTAVVIIPVCLGAAVVFGLALVHGATMLAGPPIALLAAATLAEALPVPIEGVAAGATSFSNVFIAASATLYGWKVAAVVGVLTMLLVELYRRRPVVQLLYNSSLYALAGAAAGAVAQTRPEQYRMGFLSTIAFYAVDVALLSAVVARARRASYLSVARTFYRSTLLPLIVMVTTTAILVRLWRDSPYYALMLLPPLVSIVFYQRSLVAAMKRQRELDQLKDEFIAVISHELRTPLSSVYGGVLTLEQRRLDEPSRQRLIAVIRRESARLAKLVDDVLWVSRLDAKKNVLHRELFDVGELIRDIVATADELAPDNISVVADCEDDVPRVLADSEQLQRVLANLVDNAVKYSPDGGTIVVGVQAVEAERLRFTVKDEGIGIVEEDSERIFERFVRLDPQMSRGIGGTGLGLYICRELVTEMGGRIWALPNEGRGSTFAFEIPIETTKGEG